MATFGPTACSLDTMIAEFVPNRVYGAGTYVQVSYAFAGQKNKGLISWDVSSIPVGATVSAASIVLSYSAETLSTDRPATVYPCKRLIVEGTGAGSETADGTTWNKYNVADDWQTAGGEGANDYDSASGSAFTLTNSTADITINALTAVSAALTNYRSGNYITLLFQADAVWSANEYWRGDARTVTAATLEVTYTAGGSHRSMTLGVGN